MHSVSFKNAATSTPALLDDVQTPLAHPAETRATGLKKGTTFRRVSFTQRFTQKVKESRGVGAD